MRRTVTPPKIKPEMASTKSARLLSWFAGVECGAKIDVGDDSSAHIGGHAKIAAAVMSRATARIELRRIRIPGCGIQLTGNNPTMLAAGGRLDFLGTVEDITEGCAPGRHRSWA